VNLRLLVFILCNREELLSISNENSGMREGELRGYIFTDYLFESNELFWLFPRLFLSCPLIWPYTGTHGACSMRGPDPGFYNLKLEPRWIIVLINLLVKRIHLIVITNLIKTLSAEEFIERNC
jgi:hypothetical protein